jgi:prevent-host-death family protein
MSERVSTMEVRARIGDMLNRVALRHDEFIIERKGKPLAALVPVERLEQMRRFARQHALAFLERQKAAAGDKLSDDEAMRLALDAQRATRRRPRAGQSGTKRSRKK